MDVVCDLDALALGVDAAATDSAALAAEIDALPPDRRQALVADLSAMLKRRVRVLFDGQPAALEVALTGDRLPWPSTTRSGQSPERRTGGSPPLARLRPRTNGRAPP